MTTWVSGWVRPPNDPSTDETSLADVFWTLLPVVLVFGLLVALFVVF
ncbi:hypothetical protein [Halobacterium sp. KA-6]|nr:hypothetical protein [Halobacterium sp. KA-6]MCD2203187.1 hypothetical protein [Halobacterium sp. KA-6]